MPTSKFPCLGVVILGNVGIEDIVTKAPFVEQGNGVLLETIDVFVGLHDAKECAQRLVPPVAKRLAEDGRDVVRLALEKQSREMFGVLVKESEIGNRDDLDFGDVVLVPFADACNVPIRR